MASAIGHGVARRHLQRTHAGQIGNDDLEAGAGERFGESDDLRIGAAPRGDAGDQHHARARGVARRIEIRLSLSSVDLERDRGARGVVRRLLQEARAVPGLDVLQHQDGLQAAPGRAGGEQSRRCEDERPV